MNTPATQSRMLALMERANRIASQTSLDTLLDQMLALILVVAGAQTGTLYLIDRERNELVFEVIHGPKSSKRLRGRRMPITQGIVGACIAQKEAIVVEDLRQDQRWFRDLDPETAQALRNAITFPLLLNGEPIGAVQVFNYQYLELAFLQTLGNRMASEIEKARLLEESRRLSARLQTLVDVMQHIGATLEREALLEQILHSTTRVLEAEGAALYAQHEPGYRRLFLPLLSKHPIADVIDTSQLPPVVAQVLTTHQPTIMHMPGDKTQPLPGAREVLAAPLLSPSIALGREQGETPTELLGALVAYNKQSGHFTAQDSDLLSALAQQAATVLQISRLYQTAQELFLSTIESLVAAIDAKDPYTQGHSTRVSRFSVTLGRVMGLPPQQLHDLRLGSLLHDIGKIGIPDQVLKKPGPLTEHEYQIIQQHPTLGRHILEPVRHLQNALPAIEQHHERLNGTGYPHGLQGEAIHLHGRIVAVADVFDAMTSDRPYRKALDVEEVFDYLQQRSPAEFDPACVQALIQAYRQGEIVPASRGG